jgi:hypothetical protein
VSPSQEKEFLLSFSSAQCKFVAAPLDMKMSFFAILLLAGALLLVAANPDPLVTPTPIRMTPKNLHLILAREHELLERASSSISLDSDGMNFCAGQPSICEESNNLGDKCQQYYDQEDYTKYFTCLCTNGAVAAEIAYVEPPLHHTRFERRE